MGSRINKTFYNENVPSAEPIIGEPISKGKPAACAAAWDPKLKPIDRDQMKRMDLCLFLGSIHSQQG